MKAFSLGGFEGVGGAWKMPFTDETFDSMLKTTASWGGAIWHRFDNETPRNEPGLRGKFCLSASSRLRE